MSKPMVRTNAGDFVLYNYMEIKGRLRAVISYRLRGEHFEEAGPVSMSINTPYGVMPFTASIMRNFAFKRQGKLFEWIMAAHPPKPRKDQQHRHRRWAISFAMEAHLRGGVPTYALERLLNVTAEDINKGIDAYKGTLKQIKDHGVNLRDLGEVT